MTRVLSATGAPDVQPRSSHPLMRRMLVISVACAFAALLALPPAVSHAAPECERPCSHEGNITVEVPAKQDPPKPNDPPPPPTPTDPPAPPASEGKPGTDWNTNAPKTPPAKKPGANPPPSVPTTPVGNTETTTEATAPAPRKSATEDAEKALIDNVRPFADTEVTVTGTGFTPGEQVQLVLYGATVTVVASYPAGEDGTVVATFRVPKELAAGVYTAELTGWASEHVQNVDFTVIAKTAALENSDNAGVWMWWLGSGIIALILATVLVLMWRRARVAVTPRSGAVHP